MWRVLPECQRPTGPGPATYLTIAPQLRVGYAKDLDDGKRRGPLNSTPVGVDSISLGHPHVRCTPMGRTCSEPNEIKQNVTALVREQGLERATWGGVRSAASQTSDPRCCRMLWAEGPSCSLYSTRVHIWQPFFFNQLELNGARRPHPVLVPTTAAVTNQRKKMRVYVLPYTIKNQSRKKKRGARRRTCRCCKTAS